MNTIADIHRAFRSGALTVRELALTYLSRISAEDAPSGGFHSVIEINPDLLLIADSMDYRIKRSGRFPSLFGIPILLKDNINTGDKLHTSAGSEALAGHYAEGDAGIVARLRGAGALILGKTNMTEFANYISRQGMPNGYSSRGGQVLNPHNRNETPGGSSSGSAVAVAAGLCTAAVGTETSGSILHPAWHNGVVGIKPTLGLVGRSGIIPISNTLDTAGPMAGSVDDAAVLLSVLAGFDSDDCATWGRGREGFTGESAAAALKDMRIGINHAPGEIAPSADDRRAFGDLCNFLESAGAVLVRDTDIEGSTVVDSIMKYEFKGSMNAYLSRWGRGSGMKTLKDIIDYNEAHAETALKYGQDLFLEAENNTLGTMIEGEYLEALLERDKKILELDGLFEKHGLDLLLSSSFTNLAPLTGFPSMTVPIGRGENNVPIGSYWIGRRYDEQTLIKAGRALEDLGKPFLPHGTF